MDLRSPATSISLLALLLGACGGSSDVCEAGRTLACACPGAADGAQTCLADGSAYDVCVCGGGGGGGGGAAAGSTGSGGDASSSSAGGETSTTSAGGHGTTTSTGTGGSGGGAGPTFSVGLPSAGGDATSHGIAFDASGNLVVSGWFSGTVDFGMGPVAAVGASDVFLLKYGPTGALIWARTFGAALGADHIYGIGLDAQDRIVVGGDFTRSLDFGAGVTISAATSTVTDAFLASFSPDGHCLWAHRYGDAGGAYVSALAVEPGGNAYAAGSFHGTIQFGASALANPPPGNTKNLFLASVDAAGAGRWAIGPGSSPGPADASALAVAPSGDVVFVGAGRGALDFGGAPLTTTATSAVVVARLHADGTAVWSEAFGTAGDQTARAVTVDAAGNIALAGSYTVGSNLDFGGGPMPAGSGGFVAELDGTGAYAWAHGFVPVMAPHAPPNVFCAAVVTNAARDVLMDGWFVAASVDFGGGPVTGGGDRASAFLASYDKDGNPLAARVIGTDMSGVYAEAIAIDASGSPALAGEYIGSVNFGDGPLPDSQGGAFFAKVAP